MDKQNIKALGAALMHLVSDIFVMLVRAQLRFDRKVLKRHFRIETPLYRLWWSDHCKQMQCELDNAHSLDLIF